MDEVLDAGRRQVLFGIGWTVAGAIALFYSFGSSGSGFFWYGAFIGSLIHWYRAFVLYRAGLRHGWRALRGSDIVVVCSALALVIGCVRLLVPEYDRISVPQVGTCWSEADADQNLTAIACWSNQVAYKTIREASSPASCGTEVYIELSNPRRALCLEPRN